MSIEKLRDHIEAGFSVILLRPRSKAPVENDWTSKPTLTFSELEKRARRDSNFGVRLGRPSKVDGRYLHVLDVDIRNAEYEEEALDALHKLLLGVKWWKYPHVKSGSGGPSIHVYFLADTAFKSKKIAKSDKKFADSEGKSHNYWEIELFGTGKQVVLPPSVHPGTGNPYKWLRNPDFSVEGCGFLELDGELLAELVTEDDAIERVSPRGPTDLTMEEAEDLLYELRDLSIDRETWLRGGMAIEHQFGQKGYPLFKWWSKLIAGDKYDEKRNLVDWRSFKGKTHPNPVTLRSFIRELGLRLQRQRDEANLAEFRAMSDDDDEVDAKSVNVSEREHKQKDNDRSHDLPKHFRTVPGALQHVVDFYNRNSMVDQPEFAVMAALAFGSVIAGRNTVTNLRNYSSVYFLGIGGSGSGKESVRTTLNHLLFECGFEKMAGPQYMTSEGALITYLQDSPKLLLTPDEMGKRMKEDRGNGNPYAEGVYRAYMSIFGSMHTEWKPSGYSGRGKSKEEVKNILSLAVRRPALTIVGMTTPSTFYETIGRGDVASGFLARFVIVQGKPEIQTQRILVPKDKVHPDLVDWAKHVSLLCNDPDEEILLKADQAAEVAPYVVPFSDKAFKRLHEIEEERAKRMREIERHGLAEIFNRTREITQRLSLIIALSDDYEKIQTKHLEWAWSYVKHYANKTVEAFLANLGRGELHQIADQIAEKIKTKQVGERGMTARDIGTNVRAYRSLSTRDSREVLDLLKRDHGIMEHKLGKQRMAFVAPKYVRLKESDDEE